MSENTKPNNERPADLAVQDSVGGMARRLLNPAHLRDLAVRSVKTLREQGAEQLWRDVKFRVGLAMHHDDWRHRADIPLRRELKAQRAAHLRVQQRQRPSALKRAGGANVLAEPGRALTHYVHREQRRDYHKPGEHRVLEPLEPAMARQTAPAQLAQPPGQRYAVYKLLQQPERAEPAAYGPAQQRAEEYQRPRHVPRKRKAAAAQHRLQRAYRAGAQRAGAGVAVKPRQAQALACAGVYAPVHEARRVSVAYQRGAPLRSAARPPPYPLCPVSQCPHTPDICA